MEIGISRSLRGDGAAALPAAPEEVGEKRARDAFEVDAEMLEEAPVLGGDDGIEDVRRDLVERHEEGQHALAGERAVGRGRDADLAVRGKLADLRRGGRPHEARPEQEEGADPHGRQPLHGKHGEPAQATPHPRYPSRRRGGRRVPLQQSVNDCGGRMAA
jgi:hypothetical protein